MNYLISFLIILFPLFIYGQEYPIQSVIGKDTVLIFSQEQANKIAQWNEERKYCNDNNELLKLELQQKDTIIHLLENQINEFVVIEDKYKSIIKGKDELQEICNDEKNILNKEVKRQKRQKWASIIGGIVVGVVAIIL